jgi:carboxynorspermidine decarboxylase
MRYSSHVTFNSLEQYRKFAPVLQREGKHISPGLRINPEYSEIAHGIYNPCSPGSRLGVTAAELATDCRKGWRDSIFTSCLSLTHIPWRKCLQWLRRSSDTCCHKLKWLNMGGGHLMTRRDYNTAISLAC